MDLGPYLLFASLEGLVHAAVLSLIALGLSLVFGVMRVVNVAHGEFFMLGAILAWWVTSLISGNHAIGFLIALTGAIGFAISGNYLDIEAPFSLGFVNIPAFLIFVPITTIMAKVGAKTVHRFNKKIIGKIFGIFLFFISCRLFYEYFSF